MSSKYKTQKETGSVGDAVSSGFGELESLRDEVQEIVNNASGTGLENTSRIQTFEETASSLDGVDSEPDVPAILEGTQVGYIVMVSRRGTSRAVRCSNAVSALQAAVDAANDFLEVERGKPEAERRDELIDEVEEFSNSVQEVIDNAEGAEFPGMFG